jgi:hypothetical protein
VISREEVNTRSFRVRCVLQSGQNPQLLGEPLVHWSSAIGAYVA